MVFGSYTISKDSISNDSISAYRRYMVPRNGESSDSVASTFAGNLLKRQEKVNSKDLNAQETERKIAAEERKQQALRAQQEQERYEWEDQYIDDLVTHQYNLAFIATTKDYKTGHRYSEVKGSFNSSSVNFNKNKDAMSFDEFNSKGIKYSSEKGQKLARDIASHSVGFTGYCSRHVRQGLQRTGMHNGHTGSAYQMGGVLAENENFQEITINNKDDLKKLPAGCIVVYDRGAAGYSSEHGHIEVTLGDGTACSDGRTYNMRYAQNMRVFVPVEQA